MTLAITWGWWLVPAVVTLLALGWAGWYWCWLKKASYGYITQWDGLAGLFYTAAAIIVALTAWLIWALFR